MRKKSSMQNNGYNNQRSRPRYTQGGGNGGDHRGGGHQHGGNRPRRNYGAAREKYLAQARDALASGDRVLAENYLQHADHCYRMLMEEGASRPQHRPQPQPGEEAQPQAAAQEGNEYIPENTSALPAFLTASYEQQEQKPAETVPAQNWEERDQ